MFCMKCVTDKLAIDPADRPGLPPRIFCQGCGTEYNGDLIEFNLRYEEVVEEGVSDYHNNFSLEYNPYRNTVWESVWRESYLDIKREMDSRAEDLAEHSRKNESLRAMEARISDLEDSLIEALRKCVALTNFRAYTIELLTEISYQNRWWFAGRLIRRLRELLLKLCEAPDKVEGKKEG